MGPTTPYAQRLPAVTRARFSLLRFRSPLLTEYLLLPVLRCFTSRRSLPHPMHSGTGSTTRLVLGFPIRTPSDHGSLASSPRIIAGCYVLLRLLVPRHPPCALHELHNTTKLDQRTKDARVHCTVLEQPPADHQHHPPAPLTDPRQRRDRRNRYGRPAVRGPRPRHDGRCLRTQQRAKTPTHPRPTRGPGDEQGLMVDVPPRTAPRTVGAGTAREAGPRPRSPPRTTEDPCGPVVEAP